MLGSLLFYKVLFCKGIKKWKKKMYKSFFFYYEGILGFGADMCVYKIRFCFFFLTKRRQKKTRDEFNSGYEKNVSLHEGLGSF